MKYLAIGDTPRLNELASLLPNNLTISMVNQMPDHVESYDVVFDLCFDEIPSRLRAYQQAPNTLVVAGAAGQSLAGAVHSTPVDAMPHLIGMNTLPTFINRPILEWSAWNSASQAWGDEVAKQLQLPVEWVQDRVGLVTPRIVLMLINEACYTLQEGTADMGDIDKGMKLGTNYPFGPFEWADRIGISHVYRILQAMHRDTGDIRYQIAPLLTRQYQLNQPFYG
jgi:3-hydroxybutyryl-CoA dehydrogenase